MQTYNLDLLVWRSVDGLGRGVRWHTTQSCLEMDPNGKKEKRPAKDHPAEISGERAGVVGSNKG